MKKIFSLIFVLLLVFSLIGCEKAPLTDNTPSSSEVPLISNSSTPSVTPDSSTPSQEAPKESLTERLKKELEDGYNIEAELPEYGTTIGMVELADKYTKKWADTADEYYKKIAEYTGAVNATENYQNADELHTYITTLKTTRENKMSADREAELKKLQDTYGGGSIIGPAFAVYKLEQQKEWALELVKIYENLQ